LICWSLGLPAGYWGTETSVTLPPSTVTWTWTGPHWVWATVPVTVRADDGVDSALGEGGAATVAWGPGSGPASEVR
jgi:hypothetical protein